TPGRRGGAGTRLPRDSRADAVLRLCICVHQSGRRLRLYAVRPAHQVLTMATSPNVITPAAQQPDAPARSTAWLRVRQGMKSWPVLLALAILLLITAAAVLAPWL